MTASVKAQPASERKVILFVDTGDNCRCPMAAGYLLKLMEQRSVRHVDLRTAGVMTPTGLLPTPEAVLLLHEEGVDIRRHRSRPLTKELIKRADLILGMTPFHVQSALRISEDARGKTYLLKEYVGREGKNTQIADPMGGTLEIFKRCFSEIKASLQRLMEMDIITHAPKREPVAAQPKPAKAERAKPAAAKAAEPRGKKPKAKPAARVKKPAKPKSKPAPKRVAAKRPKLAARKARVAAAPKRGAKKPAAKPRKVAKARPAKVKKTIPARKKAARAPKPTKGKHKKKR